VNWTFPTTAYSTILYRWEAASMDARRMVLCNRARRRCWLMEGTSSRFNERLRSFSAFCCARRHRSVGRVVLRLCLTRPLLLEV